MVPILKVAALVALLCASAGARAEEEDKEPLLLDDGSSGNVEAQKAAVDLVIGRFNDGSTMDLLNATYFEP